MTKKDKFILAILTILTLGFCWLHWHLQNKKTQAIKQGKANYKLNNHEASLLCELLGSKDNIAFVEAKGSKLIVQIKDKNSVQLKQIIAKKLASGAFMNTDKVSLIVAEKAQSYAQALQQII
ncbi:hypothetical protein [Mycoplasma simbae]|uniref:hypothetical protein n=1 Tax=Mycoplasma simbae TaxID=36744 RepID=UPI0004960DE9|nr:hypothetical protein [Mycoplasma simbae]